MAVRTAEAQWDGTLREGHGKVKAGSGLFEADYSFPSRFEEGRGTNPEELIGAAHAGCFSMALAGALAKDGYNPKHIRTRAEVHLDKMGDGYAITTVKLHCEAQVPGIDNDKFRNYAQAAKRDCPVSKALTGTDIELEARLLATV